MKIHQPSALGATLMRLSRDGWTPVREANFSCAHELKLRYKDFTTITRAHTLPSRRNSITKSLNTL